MNDNLRKAINVKAALRRKYNKVRSQENWQKFKQERNKVNKLKNTLMTNVTPVIQKISTFGKL